MSVNDKTALMTQLQQTLQRKREERARAEANLETAEKQKAEVVAELLALGLTPEELDAEIARVENERDLKLAQAAQILGV